eukprot:6022413-Prymnesium_polylepis.1
MAHVARSIGLRGSAAPKYREQTRREDCGVRFRFAADSLKTALHMCTAIAGICRSTKWRLVAGKESSLLTRARVGRDRDGARQQPRYKDEAHFAPTQDVRVAILADRPKFGCGFQKQTALLCLNKSRSRCQQAGRGRCTR